MINSANISRWLVLSLPPLLSSRIYGCGNIDKYLLPVSMNVIKGIK
jgi:hypothetical protein